MASLDGKDAASSGEERWIVSEESATAEVSAYAAGGYHVGCVDEGDGIGGGGKLVRARWDRVITSIAQYGGDGLGVGIFVLREEIPLDEEKWGCEIKVTHT